MSPMVIAFRILRRCAMLFLFAVVLSEISILLYLSREEGIDYVFSNFLMIQKNILILNIKKGFWLVLMGDFIGGSFFRYIYNLKEDDSRR